MPDKFFIGRVKAGKYPNTFNGSFMQADLDLLQSYIENTKFVNWRIALSKKGNWYMELLKPLAGRQQEAIPQREEAQELGF